ncbi:MAG: hypothetical protein IT443_00170 [Phycisphaeraceae bacterium]|nr:hypothetical protein [Phycisphaeraceae bacterium]
MRLAIAAGMLMVCVLGAVVAAGGGEQGAFVPRHYYGAKLEPVEGVLHGAGQCRVEDVQAYEQAIEPYRPVVFMDYFNLKGDPKAFVQSLREKLAGLPHYAVVQLGLSMTSDGRPERHYEQEVADGLHDEHLRELFAGLRELGVPVYLRIGYECNGSWNGSRPESYRKAFAHVTKVLRQVEGEIATVWCPHPSDVESALPYYPGDEWVDWWAVDLFGAQEIAECKPLLTLAHEHGKPVMIGESTPHRVGVHQGQQSWNRWFGRYFQLIRESPGIKAFCYINWDWSQYPQWQDWGDARLQENKVVADLYRKEMACPLYLHGSTEEEYRKALQVGKEDGD